MVDVMMIGQQLGFSEEEVMMLHLGWKGMKWRPLGAYTNHYWRALYRLLGKYFAALARWAGLGFTVQNVRGVLEKAHRFNLGLMATTPLERTQRRTGAPFFHGGCSRGAVGETGDVGGALEVVVPQRADRRSEGVIVRVVAAGGVEKDRK